MKKILAFISLLFFTTLLTVRFIIESKGNKLCIELS